MGWFKRKIKQPVSGTAQIVQCSQPGNPRAINSRCSLFLVVEAPGIEPFSHELSRQIAVARWPSPGMSLPCVIDRDDHSRVDIDFDAIPDWQDAARNQAAQVAAARGTDVGAGASAPATGAPVTVIGAASPEQAAVAIRQAEQATGMDLNGDGQVG